MQPSTVLKKFGRLFAAMAMMYFLGFYAIEHYRNRLGPWEVVFTAESGVPAIVINQPNLKLRDCRLVFSGVTNSVAPQNIRFDTARPVPFTVPYGECVFQDTLTMPGNVTLRLFGHEIQLLPRVLTVDKKEIAWHSGDMIPVSPK